MKGVSRQAILDALAALDDEAFSFIAGMSWQQARTAGGFRDRTGWLTLQRAIEDYLDQLAQPEPERKG